MNNYSQYLGSQPKGSGSQSRESEELEAKQKQIDVLNAEKKKINAQLNEVKGPIKDATMEKFKAQQEMTEKRVKRNYKFFEKKSDELPVKLMETFVACLRGKESSGPEDVELYLKKHAGLMCACNNLDPKNISRPLAKIYLDKLKEMNDDIKDPQYANFVPYYVWLDTVCKLVKLGVEERQVLEEMNKIDSEIAEVEVEMEQIKIIMAHKNMDPASAVENEEMNNRWVDAANVIASEVNRDSQRLSNFDTQIIGSVKNM